MKGVRQALLARARVSPVDKGRLKTEHVMDDQSDRGWDDLPGELLREIFQRLKADAAEYQPETDSTMEGSERNIVCRLHNPTADFNHLHWNLAPGLAFNSKPEMSKIFRPKHSHPCTPCSIGCCRRASVHGFL